MAGSKKPWKGKGTEEFADVRQEITDRIIEALENGTAPWQKPWVGGGGRAYNPQSNITYSGINSVMLAMSGYTDPRWMTYRQASDAGWQVRKGEKGTTVVKLVEAKARDRNGEEEGSEGTENGEEKSRTVRTLKSYKVFNAAQIEGIPPLEESMAPAPMVEELERALRAMMQKTGLKYDERGDKAYYSPSEDKVVMPPRENFKSEEGFYSTLGHEMVHSTIPEHRCGRKEGLAGGFGSQAYAREELVAEIGASMLCQMFGVHQDEKHFENHASYVASWIKCLREDKGEIIRAAAAAEKACKFVVDLERALAAEEKAAVAERPVAAASAEVAPAPALVAEPAPKDVADAFVGTRGGAPVRNEEELGAARKAGRSFDGSVQEAGAKAKGEPSAERPGNSEIKNGFPPPPSRPRAPARAAGMSR